MSSNLFFKLLISLSILIAAIETELLSQNKTNCIKSCLEQIIMVNDLMTANKRSFANITWLSDFERPVTENRVNFYNNKLRHIRKLTNHVGPKYKEVLRKSDEKSFLQSDVTKLPCRDVIKNDVLSKRPFNFKRFKNKRHSAKKWWLQQNHQRRKFRQRRKNDVKSKNKFSFSQMCFQEVREVTEYITKTKNMYVTQTVLFTSVIPTYVYANSVVTKWDEIEETFIIFKTEGVSTIVEKSTVPYAMTTYTTVYETVFRPMDVTLTFYYQIYKTEVSYSTVTETKATEELFTLFETAYKRIQKTVTSFTPAIVLLNVVNPIMMGVTYTHLAVYEDCPHDEVMEYLGSNNLEIINQYDYSKHLVTEPLSIIITSERQSKHVSPRHISSIYEPNIDVHLESANKFEFTRLKNITKVPVDARISKTNITPRRTRFNTSYSKFISLPRDMISALSDKHRSLSTLDVKYNYRKEKDHEENGSIESEQRPRLYSSLENEIVSNF